MCFLCRLLSLSLSLSCRSSLSLTHASWHGGKGLGGAVRGGTGRGIFEGSEREKESEERRARARWLNRRRILSGMKTQPVSASGKKKLSVAQQQQRQAALATNSSVAERVRILATLLSSLESCVPSREKKENGGKAPRGRGFCFFSSGEKKARPRTALEASAAAPFLSLCSFNLCLFSPLLSSL